jgi:general secretion pathway protein J
VSARPLPRAVAARGFTLIEVMIAVGITAIIGVMVMGSFQRANAARESVAQQDEIYAGARLTLTRMSREVSMAFLSDHYDRKRYRERPTLFKGRDRGRRDTLLFTTLAHERLSLDAKESDEAVVEYTVQGDPDRPGTDALFRREKPRIDDSPDRGGTTAIVCDRVTTFDVEYWDWKRQDWVRDWDTTSTERQNVLPTRVKMKLGLTMPDGTERTFETQARVAIIRPMDF